MRKLLSAICALLLSSTVAVAANPQVQLKTNLGTITVELYPDKAPQTVKNFLEYVQSDFYTGTIFHRVIPGFMIQGGGFSQDFTQRPTRDPSGRRQLKSCSSVRPISRMAGDVAHLAPHL